MNKNKNLATQRKKNSNLANETYFWLENSKKLMINLKLLALLSAFSIICGCETSWKKESIEKVIVVKPEYKANSKNLLKNPGFEKEMKNWSPIKLTLDSNARIVGENSYEGKKCLKLTPGRKDDYNIYGEVKIMNDPIPKKKLPFPPESTITFSAYMRSDKEDCKAQLTMHNFRSKVFLVNKKWKRYSITSKNKKSFKLKAKSLSVSITLKNGNNLYIDGLQLEKGKKATAFTNSDTHGVALIPSKALCYYPNENISISIKTFNYTPSKLRIVLCDSKRKNILTKEIYNFTKNASDGNSHANLNFELKNPGYYEIYCYDPQFPLLCDFLSIACIRKLSQEMLKEKTPVALHTSPRGFKDRIAFLKRSGVNSIRFCSFIRWDHQEAIKGNWKWPDASVNYAKKNGFELLLTLQCIPKWACPKNVKYNNKAMPESALPGWRNFVSKAAKRYPYVKKWECWNEPNWLYGYPMTPERIKSYSKYLKVMYEEIHKQIPTATVLGIGAAGEQGSAYEFVKNVLLQASPYMDKISFHPYTTGFKALPDLDKWEQRLNKYKLLAEKYKKALVISEMGWDGGESTEAAYMNYPRAIPRAICMALNAGIDKFYFFNFDGANPWGWSVCTSMGFLHEKHPACPRRSFVALAAARYFFSGIKSIKKKKTFSKNILCYLLKKEKKNMAVFWQTKDSQEIIAKIKGKNVNAYNLFGKKLKMKEISPSRGYILPCSQNPIYLEWDGEFDMTLQPIFKVMLDKNNYFLGSNLTGEIESTPEIQIESFELPAFNYKQTIRNESNKHPFSCTLPNNYAYGPSSVKFLIKTKNGNFSSSNTIYILPKGWRKLLKNKDYYTIGDFSKSTEGWKPVKDIQEQNINKVKCSLYTIEKVQNSHPIKVAVFKVKAEPNIPWTAWMRRDIKNNIEAHLGGFETLEFKAKPVNGSMGTPIRILFAYNDNTYDVYTLPCEFFSAINQWQNFSISLNEFKGLKTKKVKKILIGTTHQTGSIQFLITDIKLKVKPK